MRSSWPWRHPHPVELGVALDLDAQSREAVADRAQVLDSRVLDHQVAAGDGGQPDERRHLDVVGAQPVAAAAEPLDSGDREHVRADTLDVAAHRIQEPAQVLDVRLAGGVSDDRCAARQYRRHDRVLGAGDGRLVEMHVGAGEAAGRPQPVLPRRLDIGAEGGEGHQMRIDSAAADHVAAGRRYLGRPEAGEQRAGQQDRRPDPRAQVGVQPRPRHLGRPHPDGVAVEPLDLHPDVHEQGDHRLHVADPGDVLEGDRIGGEQARCQGRQRRVFVACRANGAGKRHAPLDHECLQCAFSGRSCHAHVPPLKS